MKAKHLLFVSPYESKTGKWEILGFDDYNDVESHIISHDLTKEYFAIEFTTLRKIVHDYQERIKKQKDKPNRLEKQQCDQDYLIITPGDQGYRIIPFRKRESRSERAVSIAVLVTLLRMYFE